jgi:hypothetical protein
MIILLPLSLFLIVGCAATESKRVTQKSDISSLHEEVVIEPNKMYEECVEAFPKHNIVYSFKSSKPLDFNVHYHGEEKIHYPVSKKLITEWNGTLKVEELDFYIEDQEFFCLMWENPHAEQVKVTFDCAVEEKGGQ